MTRLIYICSKLDPGLLGEYEEAEGRINSDLQLGIEIASCCSIYSSQLFCEYDVDASLI